MAIPAVLQPPQLVQPNAQQGHGAPNACSSLIAIAKSALTELASALSNIKDSPNALVKALKLTNLAILTARAYTGNSTFQQPLAMRINNNINLIDTFCIFDDANVFISGKCRDLNFFDNLSNALFLTADIGGVALWLQELNLIKLETIANSVGTTAKHFGSALTGLAGVAFAAMGISAAYRLGNELLNPQVNVPRSRQIVIELAWSVLEVVSKTFLLLGIANVFVIGGLGLIGLSALATTVGIISFVHSRRFDRQINA